MSAQPLSARERILETTATLLRRQGYHATGLNQIIDESHAPKGSLYHYFPGGKEELAAEAVQQAAVHNAGRVAMAVEAAGDTRGALHLVANTILEKLKESNFQEACPISTVALETSAISAPLQQVCSDAFTSMVGVLEKSLLDDGYAAEEARRWANMMLCTYLGGIILSRTHHDLWPLEDAFRTLGTILPPAKHSRKKSTRGEVISPREDLESAAASTRASPWRGGPGPSVGPGGNPGEARRRPNARYGD